MRGICSDIPALDEDSDAIALRAFAASRDSHRAGDQIAVAARTQKKKVRIQRGVGTGLGSSVKAVYKQARKVGGRVVHAAAETPEFIQATRNDRAFRAEMDDHYRAIGKRVVALHKRAHAESPFSRFKAIMKELEAFTSIEEEYRANRVRLSELRQEIRGSKKS